MQSLPLLLLLLLFRIGGGIWDLDVGELFLADCAEGVCVF